METCSPQRVLTFERTTDSDVIKSIVTHPRVYPSVSDDFSPSPDKWEPIQSELAWYVLVKDGSELLGLFALVPQNAICWEIHTCLLPSSYGARAREAAKGIIEWVFANTTCLRIVTNVPEYNTLALRFAEGAGLVEYGRNFRSYMKEGRLHTQVLLGVNKH